MAKATKLPSGNYRVQATVMLNGQKIKRSFTAPTARQAENEAYQWQEHCRMIGQDSSQMTFKEAAEDYISNNKGDLSATTVREYERILNNDFESIANKKLISINNVMLNSIKISMSHLSAKTIKNRLGFARRIFNVYYPAFIWNVSNPKTAKKKKREYSNDYIRQILKAVKGTHFEVETYLGFLSMRRSEIGGLKWTDIDFKKGTLYVSRTKVIDKNGSQIIQERTKTTESERVIYLPSYVLKLLKERKNQSNSDFVSTISVGQYRKHLQRILFKANVEPCSFHELRHIYSSLTSSLGIDSAIRMANGGWSSEKIMNGNYRHILSDSQVEANNKLDNYINTVNPQLKKGENTSEVTTKVTTPKRRRLKLARFINI